MTRRLVIVMATMTALVSLAFAIPLAVVVTNLERDDDIDSAVATARSLAAFIDNDSQPAAIELAVSRLDIETSRFVVTVYAVDGAVIGEPIPASERVAAGFAGTQSEVRENGGVVVYVPNNARFERPSDFVIRLEAPARAFQGDLRAFYITLALSALLAVALAAAVGVVAARSISRPTKRMTEAARKLQAGHLDTRVEQSGPAEIRELGATLNVLADRIEELLAEERESVADLVHRLRTPVTALHLEVEALPDSEESAQLRDRVGRLEATLSEIIAEMRRGSVRHDPTTRSNLAEVVRERVADWSEVAAEMGRSLGAQVQSEPPLMVQVGEEDLEAVVDVLLDNAMTHTPHGTSVRVCVESVGASATLIVEDDGPGFPDGHVHERGVSDGGSTGLGLDIARRTVEGAGGTLGAGRSELGGARVALRFPIPVASRVPR